MPSPEILTLTAENFAKQVLESPTPVLVDFWAERCGPCKMIAPALDELANEFTGMVKVGKFDIATDQSFVAQYRVSSIPTFLVFKQGQVVSQQIGIAGGKARLKTMMDSALA